MSGIEAFAAAHTGKIALASAAMSAVGAISQGQAQQNMANYNAAVAEREAEQAKRAAAFEESANRDQAARLKGLQRAAFAKSGVSQTGTPLLVEADTEMQAEQDALAIRYSGSIAEARAKSRASLERQRGKAAKQAGYFGAGASLLNGASRVSLPRANPSYGATTGDESTWHALDWQ